VGIAKMLQSHLHLVRQNRQAIDRAAAHVLAEGHPASEMTVMLMDIGASEYAELLKQSGRGAIDVDAKALRLTDGIPTLCTVVRSESLGALFPGIVERLNEPLEPDCVRLLIADAEGHFLAQWHHTPPPETRGAA